MAFHFETVKPASTYSGFEESWSSWVWQMQNTLSTAEEFGLLFNLNQAERRGFEKSRGLFKVAATPYYASLASKIVTDSSESNALRRIMIPLDLEATAGQQQMKDPLAEEEHNPAGRIIHRYSDRVLFLVTDNCSVYCRFCTRKRFTGHDHGIVRSQEYKESLDYIRSHPGIREVIFSGGDPLTLSNKVLGRILDDVRAIAHIEVIRIGSRMPVVCPMRIDDELCETLRAAAPVYLMTHFSHPKEITLEAGQALGKLVDHGIPVLNQMVLLNGVNNHPAIVQALSRRLLYLRVKPYYMFQCDPSEGTDHLRTTVECSEALVRELWGHLSGIAMPTLSLDIPSGGGKTSLVPNFMVSQSKEEREFVGWDGRRGIYKNPVVEQILPSDLDDYQEEWELLKNAKKIEAPRASRVLRAVSPFKRAQDERTAQQISSETCQETKS